MLAVARAAHSLGLYGQRFVWVLANSAFDATVAAAAQADSSVRLLRRVCVYQCWDACWAPY
jgi:hypothetical protein